MEQILSCVLPYILNHSPMARDTQLPTKREGNHKCSLGQILNSNKIWPRLVCAKPWLLQHFWLGLSKESAIGLDIVVGGSFTHKTTAEGEALLDRIL
jgi:hypothetical protein